MKQLNNLKLTRAAVFGMSILLASGCGGGGSGDSTSDSETTSTDDAASGTSVVSRGIITGFGSVYVNGVRYKTKGTSFSIDDDKDKDESDLKVGMIVTVKASSQDGSSKSADSITYDNELKGPVSFPIVGDPADATRKTLTILGQAVLVTADTTIDDDNGLTFGNIIVGDVLEVSGYMTDAGYTATHIELQDNDLEIEIKGHIENLGLDSFTIRGFPVSYDLGITELDDIKKLKEELYVEVKGGLILGGTTLNAIKIEGEDEGLGDDVDEAELKGVISEYNAVDNTFMLQGQMVDATGAEFEPVSLVLADDVTVEVEGYVSDGVMFADEVEQKGRKVKIQAELFEVDAEAGTVRFKFNGTEITVRVHAGTEIEDDNTGNDLLLSELAAGNFVDLEAFAESATVFNAVDIKRIDPDEIRIVAPLEDFDESTMSVVLLGIDFNLTHASFKGSDDIGMEAGPFFDELVVGAFVKIKDSTGDAVFDKAQLED